MGMAQLWRISWHLIHKYLGLSQVFFLKSVSAYASEWDLSVKLQFWRESVTKVHYYPTSSETVTMTVMVKYQGPQEGCTIGNMDVCVLLPEWVASGGRRP